jgi:hypothetical protein
VDLAPILEHGFFYGYTRWTWLVILLQAGGGLIVAVTIRYADNILKGFATSVSILVSCVGSALLLGWEGGSLGFWAGAALVMSSTYIYGVEDGKAKKAQSQSQQPQQEHVPLMVEQEGGLVRQRRLSIVTETVNEHLPSVETRRHAD